MTGADLAVSVAGSTLYELACVGVPTVALPVVKNQLGNARGLAGMGLGLAADDTDWGPAEVAALVGELADAPERRDALSEAMRAQVDGRGASRIALLLADMARKTRG